MKSIGGGNCVAFMRRSPPTCDMDIGRLCAQDLQNCLCEFAKDERVRLGEGTRKCRFRPTNESRFVLACKKIVAEPP